MMRKRLARLAKGFREDERGAVAVLLVPMLTLLGGMAALAVDGMHGFATYEKLRTTAEAAATAGVLAIPDENEARRLALLFAERNRPEGATGAVIADSDVVIGYWDSAAKTFGPPSASQAPNAIQTTASLTQAKENPLRLYFGGLLGRSTMDVSVSAIAVVQPGSACLVTLDPNGSEALTFKSNAKVNSPNCQIHTNSTAPDALLTDSNSVVKAQRVCVAGGHRRNSNSVVEPAAETGCSAAGDPFANVPDIPDAACNYNNKVVNNRTATLQPGVYCGGIEIKSNSVVTFEPGEYIMKNGKFVVDANSEVSGDQVGFYFTGSGGLLELKSNSQASFTPPRSGPLSGFVFFQDRDFGGLHQIDSNSVAKLDGAVYFPSATLESKSNSSWGSDSPCLMIVAKRVLFDSNSGLDIKPDLGKCPWMQNSDKRSRIVG